MMSTGESLGMANNLSDAIMEGLRGTGWTPPQAGRILMSIADSEKSEAMPVAALFKQLGWTVEATAGTAAYLKKWGIEAGCVERENIPGGNERHIADGTLIRRHACSAGIPCLHSISAAWAVAAGLGKR